MRVYVFGGVSTALFIPVLVALHTPATERMLLPVREVEADPIGRRECGVG